MKVFYPNGEVIDTKPMVSHVTLESGTVVIWHDKTMNSIVNRCL